QGAHPRVITGLPSITRLVGVEGGGKRIHVEGPVGAYAAPDAAEHGFQGGATRHSRCNSHTIATGSPISASRVASGTTPNDGVLLTVVSVCSGSMHRITSRPASSKVARYAPARWTCCRMTPAVPPGPM